jgi:hypothetical protein
MGLFSSKKIISVASSVYNMAGDEKDRPQFLQSLIIRNVLSGTKDSLGDTIKTGYLNGPAMRLRQFYRWARIPKNYGQVGMPTGSMASGQELLPNSLEPYIPHPAGTEVWCQHVEVADADISYWAEEWVMKNRPAELDKAWVSTYDAKTKKITIRFANNSTVIFTPNDYYVGHKYVYSYFIIITNPTDNLTISYGPDNLYIYRVGSGKPGLDALVSQGSSYGEFFPFIPVRLNNNFLSEGYYGAAFKQTTKAYQKATGGHMDELVASIKENKDLEDMDHAYVVFGVSLNVVEMSCKRYLYTFFEKLMFSQKNGPQAYQKWRGAALAAQQVYNDWLYWKHQNDRYQGGHNRESGGGGGTNPGQEPVRPRIPAPPSNQIRIVGHGALNAEYDIRLNWSYIVNGQGGGQGRPGARTNDCWIVYLGTDTMMQSYFTEGSAFTQNNPQSYDRFRIYWQRSPNRYTYLDVVGARHINMIYGGKSVSTGAKEALTDADESGFIIPLHYETWRETPIIDTSQMGTACVFIVVNSYQVTKKKWWQSGFFRIFLVIVIAIVSVVFTGGAGIGLLGAHLTVGAALGFSGMTAAIVGSVVNALAALILATLLEKFAGALGVLGPVIAAVLGILVGNVIGSFQAGSGFVLNWGSFLRADNLLKLTEAVGSGIQQMIQESTLEIAEEMQAFAKKANDQLMKIKEAYYQEFGYGQVSIDPMSLFTDSNKAVYAESPSTFLSRTTLTGTDIAEMSQDMLYNFAQYSIKLPDAFV